MFANASGGLVSALKKTPSSLVIKPLKEMYVVVYHCWSGDLTVGSFNTYQDAANYIHSHSVNAICP